MLAPLLAGGAGSSANLTPTTLSQRRRVFHVRVLDRQRWEEGGFVRGSLPQHRCAPPSPTPSPQLKGHFHSGVRVRVCQRSAAQVSSCSYVTCAPALPPTPARLRPRGTDRFEFHPNKRPAPPTHPPARPPENTMRIRQEGAPRITDVPCALPRSSFTPRGLRYPNTSTSAIVLHHPSEAPQSRSAAFSGGHSAFNPPTESPLLCF